MKIYKYHGISCWGLCGGNGEIVVMAESKNKAFELIKQRLESEEQLEHNSYITETELIEIKPEAEQVLAYAECPCRHID